MKTPDLEYTTSGLFTRFYPNTAAGEVAWLEMQKDGVAAVFIPHGDMVIAQLRRAGYSVAKAKPVKQTIDEILKELEGI